MFAGNVGNHRPKGCHPSLPALKLCRTVCFHGTLVPFVSLNTTPHVYGNPWSIRQELLPPQPVVP